MQKEFYPVIAALVFIVFDIITGYLAAAKNGTLNSTVMREGMWNKLGEICSIVCGYLAEFAIAVYGTDFIQVSVNVPIATGICAYIVIYELTSIIENIGSLNKELGVWLIENLGFEPEKVNLMRVDPEDTKEVDSDGD